MSWMDLVPWGRGSAVPVRHEPAKVASLQQEMNQLFDRFLESPFRSWPSEFQEWKPSIDISESDTEIEVSAELPGVDEEDIDVSVSDGALSVSGVRKEVKDEKRKDYHHREQFFGTFHRTIPLPSSVDSDAVSATYKKGILRVSLPKTAESRATKVVVNGG